MPTDARRTSSVLTEDPTAPVARCPPVPGWMWAVFGLGLISVGALICMTLTHPSASQLGAAGWIGAIWGTVLGLPMLGGLALAARFFNETGARLVMGVVFVVVITTGLGGILFAGCMCLLSGQNFH